MLVYRQPFLEAVGEAAIFLFVYNFENVLLNHRRSSKDMCLEYHYVVLGIECNVQQAPLPNLRL